MQKLLLLVTGVLLNFYSYSYAQSNDKILGSWTNADKSRIIEFVKSGTSYDAVIRKTDEASLLGKKQITGLVATGKNSFAKGTLHIFKRNKEADVTANLVSDKKLEIKASIGFMSKKEIWTKL